MHPAVVAAATVLADKDTGANPFGIIAIAAGVIILIIILVMLRR